MSSIFLSILWAHSNPSNVLFFWLSPFSSRMIYNTGLSFSSPENTSHNILIYPFLKQETISGWGQGQLRQKECQSDWSWSLTGAGRGEWQVMSAKERTQDGKYFGCLIIGMSFSDWDGSCPSLSSLLTSQERVSVASWSPWLTGTGPVAGLKPPAQGAIKPVYRHNKERHIHHPPSPALGGHILINRNILQTWKLPKLYTFWGWNTEREKVI